MNVEEAMADQTGACERHVTCVHKYVFVRQDVRNIGFERNPTYIVSDVFFCEKCLKYARVDVLRRAPRTDSFEMHETKLV